MSQQSSTHKPELPEYLFETFQISSWDSTPRAGPWEGSHSAPGMTLSVSILEVAWPSDTNLNFAHEVLMKVELTER